MATVKGEGVKKSQNSVDVIYGSPSVITCSSLKENSTPKGSRKRPAATPDNSGAHNLSGAKKAPTTDPGPNYREGRLVAEKHGKEYRCPKCPKAYTTLRAMKNHAKSHTMETKTATPTTPKKAAVVCSVCGDGFSEVTKYFNLINRGEINAGKIGC